MVTNSQKMFKDISTSTLKHPGTIITSLKVIPRKKILIF